MVLPFRPTATTLGPITRHFDTKLSSYSIYPNIPAEDSPLFQVVFLSTHPDDRHRSPAVTTTNPKRIIDEIQNGAREHDSDALKLHPFVTEFQGHFSNLHGQSHVSASQHLDEGVLVVGHGVGEISVSASGLYLALVNVSTAEGTTARWRVVVKQWSAYKGAGLKLFIFEHAYSLFRMLLKELRRLQRMRVGSWELLGLVVKRQVVDVEVPEQFGMRDSGGEGEGHVENSGRREGEEVRGNAMKVENKLGGVHVIVFQVEKMAKHGYRFSEGVHVGTSSYGRRVGGVDVMAHLRRWQSEGSSRAGAEQTVGVDNRARHPAHGQWTSISEVSSLEVLENFSEASYESWGNWDSEGEYIAEDGRWNDKAGRYVDFSGEDEAWVEVDLSECVEEFMQEQCDLADEYVRHDERRKRLHGVEILRGVLANANVKYEKPTLRAVRLLGICYREGCGVERDVEFGDKLDECGTYFEMAEGELVWESNEEFGAVWRQEEPEKGLVELCILHSAREKGQASLHLAAKGRNGVCRIRRLSEGS